MKNLEGRLPNTLIIGAAKAGTTTVYDLLKQHPEVFVSFDKEPRFFSHDDYFRRGVDWYTDTYFKKSANYSIRCEATPHYLYWADKVSPRIKQVCQTERVKFIVILRNPIERAYSWYWNMIFDGRETLSFMDALLAEDSRIKDNFDRLRFAGSMQYGYFHGGCYASQIQRFLEDYTEDKFQFLFLEDLKGNQGKTGLELEQFLGIDTAVKLEPRISNPSTKPRNRIIHSLIRNQFRIKNVLKRYLPPRLRYAIKSTILNNNLDSFSYPKMDVEPVGYLKEKFLPEITSLSAILNRDLSHWLE